MHKNDNYDSLQNLHLDMKKKFLLTPRAAVVDVSYCKIVKGYLKTADKHFSH